MQDKDAQERTSVMGNPNIFSLKKQTGVKHWLLLDTFFSRCPQVLGTHNNSVLTMTIMDAQHT